MGFITKFEQFHYKAKQNRWMRYFTIFNRVALAAGFLPAGYVKVAGERFTDLHNNHPMGHYLEALYHTGYYYTSIGILQMAAAMMLLIPRTATLGALLYFPIILNICVLSLSVNFIGSLHSSPLMVLANLYLLCWDYDRLKYILPLNHANSNVIMKREKPENRFPVYFFGASFATVVIIILVISNVYTIQPFNTVPDCKSQCSESASPMACNDFCDCIHVEGKSYDKCVEEYKRAIKN